MKTKSIFFLFFSLQLNDRSSSLHRKSGPAGSLGSVNGPGGGGGGDGDDPSKLEGEERNPFNFDEFKL